MAQPNKERGARSKANLKRGGTIKKTVSFEEKNRDIEIRRISKKLLLDPIYQASLRDRLNSGRIQPGVEVALYYYAFGKPHETVETKVPQPIRLVHEYTE